VKAIPWTYDERPDTRTTNVRLGVWLFLASEAMFFGSLFSAYVLLRTGVESWPDSRAFLDLQAALLNTGLLVGSSVLIFAPAKGGALTRPEALTEGGPTHRITERGFSRGRLYVSAALAGLFVLVKLMEYRAKLGAGLHPSTNLLLACWFTLTAVHALHVVAGIGVNVWLAARSHSMSPSQAIERLRATRLYWLFVDTVWIVILVAFYFI
jgi:cytochrome c oxidase subunit 3